MGLAEILSQPTRPTGMVSGYMSGLESGTNMAATNAQTAQQGLASQRYAAETPTYLQHAQNTSEAARLANLPGQANEQAGVYPAEAQSNLGKAKLTAQQAKAAMETLPKETQAKLYSEINKGTAGLLEHISNTLDQTNNVEQTIQSIEQQLPQVINDPGWQAEKQKLKGKTSQQAKLEINQMRANHASSSDYATPTSQHDFNKLDIEHTNKMQEIAALNQGREDVAGLRAKTGSTGHVTYGDLLAKATETLRTSTDPLERAHAQFTIDTINKSRTTSQEGGIMPEANKTTSTTGPQAPPAMSSGGKQSAPTAISGTDYLKGATTQEELVKRVKALKQKGWTDDQIRAAHKG